MVYREQTPKPELVRRGVLLKLVLRAVQLEPVVPGVHLVPVVPGALLPPAEPVWTLALLQHDLAADLGGLGQALRVEPGERSPRP